MPLRPGGIAGFDRPDAAAGERRPSVPFRAMSQAFLPDYALSTCRLAADRGLGHVIRCIAVAGTAELSPTPSRRAKRMRCRARSHCYRPPRGGLHRSLLQASSRSGNCAAERATSSTCSAPSLASGERTLEMSSDRALFRTICRLLVEPRDRRAYADRDPGAGSRACNCPASVLTLPVQARTSGLLGRKLGRQPVTSAADSRISAA